MENPCQIPDYCKNLEKPKKTKWQNLCPSGYQNIAKTSKNQKNQNGRTYVPVSGMGSVLWFFLVFLVFPGKTKKTKKQKKNGRTYVPVSGMGSVFLVFLVFLVFPGKTKKTKKNKMAEPMSQWIPEYCKNLEKPKKTKKKQNGRTYVPVSGMGSVLLFFLVFSVFPGKTKKNKKKTKWQNLCPSGYQNIAKTSRNPKKQKKNKMAEPMSQCLAWGQYFCFFWFFRFSQVKPKKTKKMAEPMSQCLAWGQYFWFFWFSQVKPKKPKKKTKWQNLCPSVWHGVSTFVFFGFFGFPR